MDVDGPRQQRHIADVLVAQMAQEAGERVRVGERKGEGNPGFRHPFVRGAPQAGEDTLPAQGGVRHDIQSKARGAVFTIDRKPEGNDAELSDQSAALPVPREGRKRFAGRVRLVVPALVLRVADLDVTPGPAG